MVALILQGNDQANDFYSISSRYFNINVAIPTAGIGERAYRETHLIPLIL